MTRGSLLLGGLLLFLIPTPGAAAVPASPRAPAPPAVADTAPEVVDGPPADEGIAQERAGAPGMTEAQLDDLTARVASQLRCPVCRNQSVLESSSTLAREMQSVIRDRLASGESPDKVKAYFVSRYGEWILLKPKPEGVNLLVYLLPALALLAGGALVWHLLRRWSAREPAAAGEAGAAEASDGPDAPGDRLDPEEERALEGVLREGSGGGAGPGTT